MELYFNAADAPKKCERICDLISDEVKLCLDFSEPVHSGREMRIRIYEKTPYELETYRASMCAENSQETGDSSIVFSDGVGNSYIVLSEKMELPLYSLPSPFRLSISACTSSNSSRSMIPS